MEYDLNTSLSDVIYIAGNDLVPGAGNILSFLKIKIMRVRDAFSGMIIYLRIACYFQLQQYIIDLW